MFVFKLLLLYNFLILLFANSNAASQQQVDTEKLFDKLNIKTNEIEREKLLKKVSQNEKSVEDILKRIKKREETKLDDKEDDDLDSSSSSAGIHPQNTNTNINQGNDSSSAETDNGSRKKPKKNNDELIVNTENGRVRGKAFYTDHHIPRHTKPRNYPFGRKKYRVNAWLGIPYAEKPLNELRFKRPVPIKNWDGIYNATELPNSCYQVEDTVIENFEGVEIWNPNTPTSEDCLYLNVWAPHPIPKNSPVMVS
jgi:carboxylesterase type B